jgi:hypothetical protein
MNKQELRSIIKKTITTKMQKQGINKYQEYKILNHVPDMISILTDLLSPQFNLFVKDIQWVSPKPPTFRVILENNFSFYLADLGRSWMAEVEGKQYYLLNLGEEEQATQAISRILRYGKAVNPDNEADTGGADVSASTGGGSDMEAALDEPLGGEEIPTEEPAAETPEEA